MVEKENMHTGVKKIIITWPSFDGTRLGRTPETEDKGTKERRGRGGGGVKGIGAASDRRR